MRAFISVKKLEGGEEKLWQILQASSTNHFVQIMLPGIRKILLLYVTLQRFPWRKRDKENHGFIDQKYPKHEIGLIEYYSVIGQPLQRKGTRHLLEWPTATITLLYCIGPGQPDQAANLQRVRGSLPISPFASPIFYLVRAE